MKIYSLLFFIVITGCALQDNTHYTMAAHQNTALGFAYLDQGNISLAKIHFLLALKDAPNEALPLDGMAYYYEVVGEIHAAEQYYRQALKAVQHQGEAHNNYGAFLCRQARYQAGIDQFLQAVGDEQYTHAGSAYANAALCANALQDSALAHQYALMAARYGVMV